VAGRGRLRAAAAGLGRVGWWLPLHLALAGAVSVAISGNMQAFAAALTAAPDPPAWRVRAQFLLVNGGAVLVAAGYPSHRAPVVAAGGAAFLAAMVLLGWSVVAAWRRGLNRRHAWVLALYGAAIAAVLTGGTIGSLIGSGAVHDPLTWLALRRAHMTVNVLGWGALTVAGTAVTLLPTVLRVRMPAWRGPVFGGLLAGGVALLAGGLATRSNPVAAAGAVVFEAGALGVVVFAGRAVRSLPRRRPPVAAGHLVAGIAWLVFGAGYLATTLLSGRSFDSFLPQFLVVFALGFLVQVLLGAWLYLIPMARLASPSERRLLLAAADLGGTWRGFAINGGLALLALRAAGIVPAATGRTGGAIALAGGGRGPGGHLGIPVHGPDPSRRGSGGSAVRTPAHGLIGPSGPCPPARGSTHRRRYGLTGR